MNLNKKFPRLVSVFMTILLLAAICIGGANIINADENSGQKLKPATATDALKKRAVDSRSENEEAALELMDSSGESSADDIIENTGNAVYQGTTTNYYTIKYNGKNYTAWCGDHFMTSTQTTKKFSVSGLDNSMIRKALYYSYLTDNAWTGFADMSKNQKTVVMALTLNYIRNGGMLREYCKDYYNFICEQPDIRLDGNETALSLINTETKEEVGNKHVFTGSIIYNDKTTGNVRKKTETMQLDGDADNFILLTVPSKTNIHIKTAKSKEYVSQSGECKIYGGDKFYFSSEVEKQGTDKLGRLYGQPGITAYAADTDASGDQTLVFAGKASKSYVNMSINWEDTTGYIWMSKNQVYSGGSLKYTDVHDISKFYNYDKNRSYNMAGITYAVYNKSGELEGRFISSYNGRFYQDKETGNRIVFGSPEEYNSYGSTNVTQQYMAVPFGTYNIVELPHLWSCDITTGKATNTKKPVESSGFYRYDKEISVEVTKDNVFMKRNTAVYANGIDVPITGEIGIVKKDLLSEKVIGNAEYTLYTSSGVKAGVFKSDENGIGIVAETIYKGIGTDTIKDIPIGRYTLKETKAPEGYEISNDTVYIDILWNKIVVIKNGTEIMFSDDMKIIYNIYDVPVRGDFSFIKRDADTGEPIANVKFMLEDEKKRISVIIYTDENGYYSSEASYISHTNDTNGNNPSSGIWFSYNHELPDDKFGALPSGKYYLYELRCDANKNKYKQINPVEIIIGNNKKYEKINLGDIYNEKMPQIKTTAVNKSDNTHFISPEVKNFEIVDKVSASNLEVGHTYNIKGIVMDKATGKELEISGNTVIAEKTFDATKEDMTIDVEFSIKNDNLAGRTLVIYEYLTDEAYPDEIIASHADIDSTEQAVFIEDNVTTTETTTDSTTELATKTSTETTETTTEILRKATPSEPNTYGSPSTDDGAAIFIMIVVFIIAATAAILLLIFS